MGLSVLVPVVGFQKHADIVACFKNDAIGQVFTTRRFGGFREGGFANFLGNLTSPILEKVENRLEYGKSG